MFFIRVVSLKFDVDGCFFNYLSIKKLDTLNLSVTIKISFIENIET